MSATKAQILRAIDDYREKIIAEVQKRCEGFCEQLVYAAIKNRKIAFDAHDFTGNLLNSIVVCLYRERQPLTAWYAADTQIPKAIQVEMSYKMNKKLKNKTYYFKKDYSGNVSSYQPELVTDESWGVDDAKNFFRSFTPKGKNLFDIVVAYTSEYAEFVEMQRGTTGILNAYQDARLESKMFLRLPQK